MKTLKEIIEEQKKGVYMEQIIIPSSLIDDLLISYFRNNTERLEININALRSIRNKQRSS